MPKPSPGESEKDFVARCIPMLIKEGKTQEQAQGACFGIYRNAKEGAKREWKQNIHESLSLSEAQIVPGETPEKRSHRAWWPLLKEGPGNPAHKNYYAKSALETAAPLALARKKMYFNHVEGEVKPVDRNVKDWGASVKETKIENGILWGLVQAYDPWLKERMYDAPDELACSIEGRGGERGKTIEVNGEKWNLIESVKWINAFNIVDYPGNAPMGVQLAESDKDEEITEVKKLESLAEFKEKYADMAKEYEKEIREAVQAEAKKVIDEKEAEIKALKEGKQMDEKKLGDELLALKNKLDALEVLGKEKEKRAEIGKLMESLPKEALTDTFKELCESAKDVETAKKLVDDRAKLFEGKVLGHGKTEPKPEPEALKEREKTFMAAWGRPIEEKKEEKKEETK